MYIDTNPALLVSRTNAILLLPGLWGMLESEITWVIMTEGGGARLYHCKPQLLETFTVINMPPNGPDEWRARIGHWENRKLRWYKAHCGSRPRVPLYPGLVISEAPWLLALLLLSLMRKVATGVCGVGNGALSFLGKLVGQTQCCAYRRAKVWVTPLFSLCLALSLLLLVAGDVETNPGPISGEKKLT